jgi:hypothetical protein
MADCSGSGFHPEQEPQRGASRAQKTRYASHAILAPINGTTIGARRTNSAVASTAVVALAGVFSECVGSASLAVCTARDGALRCGEAATNAFDSSAPAKMLRSGGESRGRRMADSLGLGSHSEARVGCDVAADSTVITSPRAG